MPRVLPILFGAGFTVATCVAIGLLLLRLLRVALEREEQALFAFVTGAAATSTVVFVLCVAHAARTWVFLALGVVAMVAAYRSVPRFRLHFSAYYLLLGGVFLLYFFNALAPEVSPDGSGYHLGNVLRMYEHHGFAWDFRSIYTAFPQGLEMLFLMAFAFGGGSAAALVHLSFLVVLAGLLICSGRRFGYARAGQFAAVLVFASPVVGLVGASAYNDVALATCIYAVFYLSEVQLANTKANALIAIGLLSGWCCAVKYTGWVALPFAALLLRRWEVVPGAAVSAAPWLIRNWLWLGNPVAPFLNRWFPNALYTADLEAAYLADLRHVEGLRHWWEAPLDLTIYGARMPGFLGPVFLLAPLALLALRFPMGRKLLLAFAVFLLPVWLNPAARFLMPAVPFLAMAMGMGMQNSPGVLPALAVFHSTLALPAVMPLYCADWAWRLREMPVRVALGLTAEEPYIRRHVPDYPIKELLEAHTAKQQKIFSFTTLPEMYIDRAIIVAYESSEGERIAATLRRGESVKGFGIDFVLLKRGGYSNSNHLTAIGKRDGATLFHVD